MKAGIPVNVILFDLEAASRLGAGILDNMSCSLNSLKGGYIGDYIGDYYRDY